MAKQKRSFKTNAKIPVAFMILPALTGVIFVLVGIFVMIPNLGIFGYFWTAFSAIIAIAPPIAISAMNKRLSKGVQVETSIEEEKDDIETRLQKLQSLYDKGLISKEEYETLRSNLINSL